MTPVKFRDFRETGPRSAMFYPFLSQLVYCISCSHLEFRSAMLYFLICNKKRVFLQQTPEPVARQGFELMVLKKASSTTSNTNCTNV